MRHANHTLGRGQQLAKDQRSAALACTLEGGGMGEVADCDPSTGQGAPVLERLDTSLPLEERYFSDDGQPHWCVHAAGATKRDVMAALQGAFNSSPSVLRPCEVKEITHDLAYALSYGLKPEFWRRVSSRGPEGKARRSRSLQIPTKHWRELLTVLHRWSVADRLVWITPTEGR